MNTINKTNTQNTQKNSLWNHPDYKPAIERCSQIAQQDFKFTESALQEAKTTLDNLKRDIDVEKILRTIHHNSCATAQTAQEVLKQLQTTQQSLEAEIIKNLQEIYESSNSKQRALDYFSIAFMGKTKAGKSTLHAIMSGEGWDSIGTGKQRTTRENRVYEWENIRIIDTPGIGAPGGKTDEEIAQSVISEADVICYVVTNDSIQETEFGFLRLLKENNKPLIILLNVHKNFRDSRRGPYELNKFLNNPDKLFTLDGNNGLKGHIERIRRYAQQYYGNDYFDIVPVMLLAAQLSYEVEHQDKQEQLLQASHIQNFFDEIRKSIVNNGQIRRSQTLLGCTAVELEKPQQWVQQQAENFAKSTEKLQSKHRSINREITKATNDARNNLRYEIESIFQDVVNQIELFAYNNWNASENKLNSRWKQQIKNIRVEKRLTTAYQEAVNRFGKDVQESLEEVGKELQLITKLGNLNFSLNAQNTSNERRFISIGGGIIGLAGAVMLFIPPLAGFGLIVGIVGGVINFFGGFFKSKEEKRREAAANISNSLNRQIAKSKKDTLNKSLNQFDETCTEIKVNVDNYFQELIEGLEKISKNLSLVARELLDKSVNPLNQAYGKRLIDWCCDQYEPLTQSSMNSVISQVNRNSTEGINIVTKTYCELQRDIVEIQRVVQESVSFKQPVKSKLIRLDKSQSKKLSTSQNNDLQVNTEKSESIKDELEKQDDELVNQSKTQVEDFNHLKDLSDIKRDSLRLSVKSMQNLIPLVREVEEKPTNENLNRFKTAVEETNQFLSKLENELIIENVNTVLSVDLGRVATKCCISRDPGNVMFISANVKQMSMEQLRGGVFQTNETDPLMDLWLEYQGEGYAVGALAAKFGANLGVGQSKVEYAIVKVLASAGYFKLKGNIAIVISLPYHFQEEFDKEKALLINQLIGTHVMTFRGELVELNVGKVWIMPDGYGSLLWCEAQPKKGRETTDFTKLSVAIVDIGHETTDCVMVDNFRFARGASKSEKFSMNNFYELIAEEIEGADIQSLHLIAAVNKPRGERLYRPRGASKPTNLDDFLPHLIEMFSREICSRILAWLPERVTDVILTGGGGEFFWEDVQRVLKEAQINAHLAAPSRQANVLGQYIYGEAQLSASRVKPKQKV